MKFKHIIKKFETGNVCVFGMKGSGKDVLMSNVVVRRKLPYVSNIDYGGDYKPLELEKLNVGKNNYENFINDDLIPYICPYEDKTDVYISDCGVYFPAQYCNELNKKYGYMATYSALNRQLSDSAVHVNTQHLPRIWDKYREQSEIFIYCKSINKLFMKLFKIAIQHVYIYEDYQSACQKRRPFNIKPPMFCKKELKFNIKMQKLNYEAQYGIIEEGILIYKHKSNFDTRRFKTILEKGTHKDDK